MTESYLLSVCCGVQQSFLSLERELRHVIAKDSLALGRTCVHYTEWTTEDLERAVK